MGQTPRRERGTSEGDQGAESNDARKRAPLSPPHVDEAGRHGAEIAAKI